MAGLTRCCCCCNWASRRLRSSSVSVLPRPAKSPRSPSCWPAAERVEPGIGISLSLNAAGQDHRHQQVFTLDGVIAAHKLLTPLRIAHALTQELFRHGALGP